MYSNVDGHEYNEKVTKHQLVFLVWNDVCEAEHCINDDHKHDFIEFLQFLGAFVLVWLELNEVGEG